MTVRQMQLDLMDDLKNYNPKYQNMSQEQLEKVTLPLAKHGTKQILQLVQAGTALEIAKSDVYREILLHA